LYLVFAPIVFGFMDSLGHLTRECKAKARPPKKRLVRQTRTSLYLKLAYELLTLIPYGPNHNVGVL